MAHRTVARVAGLLAAAAVRRAAAGRHEGRARSARRRRRSSPSAGPDAEALLLADRYTLRRGRRRRPRAQPAHPGQLVARDQPRLRREPDRLGPGRRDVRGPPQPHRAAVRRGRAGAGQRDRRRAAAGGPQATRSGAALRRRVIVHTALEPGAVIEASWRVTRTAPTPAGMTVAEPLAFDFPVAERIVEVEAPAGVELLVPAGARADRAGAPSARRPARVRTCRWRLDGVAGAAGEPGTPPRVEMRAVRARRRRRSRGGRAGPAPSCSAAGTPPDRAPAGAIDAGPQGGRRRAGPRARPARGAHGPQRRGQRQRRAPRVPDELGASTRSPPCGRPAGRRRSRWRRWQARVLGELGFDARPGARPDRPAGRLARRASRSTTGPSSSVRFGARRRPPLRPARAGGREAARAHPRTGPTSSSPATPSTSAPLAGAVAAPSRGVAHRRRQGRRQGRAGADDEPAAPRRTRRWSATRRSWPSASPAASSTAPR